MTEMKAWGECHVMRLTEADGEFPDELSGYTVVQLLHTSNLTMHVCDKAGSLYFDLFSCKKFDNDKAVDVLQKYFQPQSVRVSFLTRHA
jgi:S-adenosylmethionine/arginine decarboxylase-like enzyme